MIQTGLDQSVKNRNSTHDSDAGLPILFFNGDVNGCNIANGIDSFNYPRLGWSIPSPKYGDFCKTIGVPSYEVWESYNNEHETPASWNLTFDSHSKQYPWSSKINKGVWRGSTTYDQSFKGAKLNETPRGKLVQKSMETPELIDAAFVNIIQQYRNQKQELQNQTILRDRMPFDDYMKYKAIIDIDGNNWSSRFPKLLCSNSIVIKVCLYYL